jgi:hypothetical protein
VAVVHVGQRGLVLRSPGPVSLEPRVRVGFIHQGEHPGRIRVLAQVERHEVGESGAMIALRPLVLHTADGRPCLSEFLTRFMKQDLVREDRYEEGQGGLFYHLGDEGAPATARTGQNEGAPATARTGQNEGAPATARTGKRAKPNTAVRQLTTVRVPVRVKIAYLLEKQPDKVHNGTAYNVTDHGLYVSTDGVLPDQGDPVRIIYPMTLHAKPFNVKLTGEVYWTTGPSTGGGGGFAVHLVLAEDDPATRPWREYVEREIAYKGAPG